jgi:hypothetical protein
MLTFVATVTQGNQIEIVIPALLATHLFVAHLQILPRTTDLASPAVTP